MIKAFIFVCALLKYYHIITIYQQSHYKIKESFIYYLKHFAFYNVLAIVLFILGYIAKLDYVKALVYFYLFVYNIFLILRLKVKLKITSRIIRMSIANIFIMALLAYYLNEHYYIILEYIFCLVFIIENQIERLLGYRYIIKASKKIKAYKGVVVGITGSYGKTTTKSFMKQILESKMNVLATPKSYNTELGIAKFLNNHLLDAYDLIILEFGATKKNDIDRLLKYYPIQIGVLTEVGPMHLDSFKTEECILKEKVKIIERLQTTSLGIIYADNPMIMEYSFTHKNNIYYGLEHGDYVARNISSGSFLIYQGSNYKNVVTNLNTKLEIKNVLPGLILYDHYYGLESLMNLTLVHEPHHFSIKKYKDYTLIDNAYNSNLYGALDAIDYLKTLKGIRIVITPGFVENKKVRVIQNKQYAKSLKDLEYILLVRSRNTFDISCELKKYLSNYRIFDSFNEAFRFFKTIKGEKSLLIENDLLDIYREWD